MNTNMTRNQAAALVRDCANGLIDQLEREAKGWDKGEWRSDTRVVARNQSNTIAALKRELVRVAYAAAPTAL